MWLFSIYQSKDSGNPEGLPEVSILQTRSKLHFFEGNTGKGQREVSQTAQQQIAGIDTHFLHNLFQVLTQKIIADFADKGGFLAQLLEQGIPLVFFDFPLLESAPRGSYDIILPESEMAVKYYCMQLIREAGCKTFGFVGDYRHCRSFYERFTGMREALFLSGLPVDLQYSILEDDASGYTPERLSEMLDQLPGLPDCFVTANDSIAINLIAALKSKKIHIPKDVKVVGFDNNPKAKNLNPQLTSFNVDKVAGARKLQPFCRSGYPTLLRQIR